METKSPAFPIIATVGFGVVAAAAMLGFHFGILALLSGRGGTVAQFAEFG